MKTTYYFLAFLLFVTSTNLLAQKKTIDISQSSVEWIGKKIGGQHQGLVSLKKGTIEEKDGEIISGSFIIDMKSITNTDLTDEEYNQKLVGHLKSEDFFGVDKYPTVSFKITKSSQFENEKSTITGQLTIKGITETISFTIAKLKETYTAKIEVDRSKFDVKYGSSSFFDNLGDKVIDDIFILDVKLILE